MRVLKNRCTCPIWPAHEASYHDAHSATSRPEPSIVLWLRSLFSFGLRWCVYWVIGLVYMASPCGWGKSKNVYQDKSESQSLMELKLKRLYSEIASKLSSDELEDLRQSAARKTGTLHYPPKGDPECEERGCNLHQKKGE